MSKQPPFKISPKILNLSIEIGNILGSNTSLRAEKPKINLRKSNKIKTIQSSLAIEGNTLSVAQITDLIDNIPIVGPLKDIKEVKNAIQVYSKLNDLRFDKISSFLKAHKILMDGLIEEPGQFRKRNVGVFIGKEVAHMAPAAKQVPRLMENLFAFINNKKDNIALLIKACVFHYELEFIHPFSDGNGRMGRLWQQLILMSYHQVFEFLAIESLIKNDQQKYYNILSLCDKEGDSTKFIELMLELIKQGLVEYYNKVTFFPISKEQRLECAREKLSTKFFNRKDYIKLHKTISTATASRDLAFGVDEGILKRTGIKRQAKYEFVIKV